MTCSAPEMNASGADKRVKGTGTLFESSSISLPPLFFFVYVYVCVFAVCGFSLPFSPF